MLPGLAAAGSCQGIMRLLGVISRGAGPEGAAAVPGALWECRAQDELTASSARLAPNPARSPGATAGPSALQGGCGGERRKMSFRGSSRQQAGGQRSLSSPNENSLLLRVKDYGQLHEKKRKKQAPIIPHFGT